MVVMLSVLMVDFLLTWMPSVYAMESLYTRNSYIPLGLRESNFS